MLFNSCYWQYFHCYSPAYVNTHTLIDWNGATVDWSVSQLTDVAHSNIVESHTRPFHLLLLIIFSLSALFSGFPWSKFGFALIISDQCWPWLLWRPVSNAETAKKKKQLSRLVPVSNMHTASRGKSESESKVWANARLQSLALSVPHYVPKASEDPNP